MATTPPVILENIKTYTEELREEAKTALEAASEAVQDIDHGLIGYVTSSIDDALNSAENELQSGMPDELALNEVEFNIPEFDNFVGQKPSFQNPPSVLEFIGDAPDVDVEIPEIDISDRPNSLPEFRVRAPDVAKDIQLPDLPEELRNINIDLPTFPDRAVPIKPPIDLPSFDAVEPTDVPVAPTDGKILLLNTFNEVNPQLKQALEADITAFMSKNNPRYAEQLEYAEELIAKYMKGGTALTPAIETQIYERAREKNMAEFARTSNTIAKEAASRGFTMPPGSMYAALLQARTSAMDANNRTINEIAINQAEREQQNLQFALNANIQIRTTMLNAALQYLGSMVQVTAQSLDVAKTVLGAVIDVFNAQVTVFNSRLDLYKTKAQVYETRLRAALATVDIYKAEIDALQALTNVDRAKLDVYRARVDVLNVVANVYKTQVDAVVSKAQMEKLKLDVFETQVRAYGAQVDAKKSEQEGYRAYIQAQEARVQAAASTAQAQAQKVQAYKAEIEAKMEAVRAIISTNQAKSDQFRSNVDAYRAVVSTKGDVARTQLEQERQKVAAYQAKLQTISARLDARMKMAELTARVRMENANNAQEAMLERGRILLQKTTAIATNSTSLGNIYQSAAASAASGIVGIVTEQIESNAKTN